MKINFMPVLTVAVVLSITAGCGITEKIQNSIATENSNTAVNAGSTAGDLQANKDKAAHSETHSNGNGIGIAECDEVYDLLMEGITPKEDESYVSKAGREFLSDQIRQSFRDSIKNEKDQERLRQKCVQYLDQLKKHNAEEPTI